MSEPLSNRRSQGGRDLTPDQRYWQLWRSGRRPRLGEFLDGLGPITPGEAAAVVAIEQYERWMAGDRVPAEGYLPLLPSGEGREQAECDIVYGEFLLAEQLGEVPALAEYQRRFPTLAVALARQVQVHHALADAHPPPTVNAEPTEYHEEFPTIPGYEILSEIGRGGMGVVYRARQTSLDRVVALKVLRVKADREGDALQRMWREAHVTARLSHPHIVTIFDAGLAGAWFYIAMEFVNGTDLHHLVEQSGPVKPALAADYLRQAALGLQHAHEAGLVHRDIKPSNLIVTVAPQAGVLKLLDLGLARPATAGTSDEVITHLGAFMGTPDFIAPEQANDPRAADVRSDLYSLGCTFYYVLTGRPPFTGATPLAKLMQHHLNDAPPLEASLPPELTAVIRKLMSKRPEDRFQTPGDLVAALSSSSPDKVTRWQGDKVTKGEGALGRPVALSRRLTGPTDWVKCVAFAPGGSPRLAAGSVDHSVRLWDVETGAALWRGDAHQSAVLCLAFATDGRMVSGGQDRTLCLWEPEGEGFGGVPRWRATGHRDNINAVGFLPGELGLLTASHDGTLRRWDLAGREREVWAEHTGPVWGVAVSSDGRVALSGGQDRTIRLWDVASGTVKATWPEQPGPVSCVALSRDGRLALSGGQGGVAQLWDVETGQPLTKLEGHEGRITAAAFSPDGRAVLTGSRDQTARLFTLGERPTLKATLSGHTFWVTAVGWSGEGTMLATGSGDRSVSVWQLST